MKYPMLKIASPRGFPAVPPQQSKRSLIDLLSSTGRPTRHRRRAKALSEDQIKVCTKLIQQVSNSPESDMLKFMLSVRAGLRAAEIANLTVDSFLDPEGEISKTIVIDTSISKSKYGRTIPMHGDVYRCFKILYKKYPGAIFISFSRNQKGILYQKPNTVAQWFKRLYVAAGFTGCSSHSGRRTFITALAQQANYHGNSLRDVQRLAGHARLDTTEAYIDYAPDSADLVRSLGKPRRR